MANKVEQIKSELAHVSKAMSRLIFSRGRHLPPTRSMYQILPMCVVAPKDANDVAAVVKYAKEHNIPIVARGAGSGLAGEALSSGIVFDMPRYMNKIISIAKDGSHIVCEPGVVLDDINNALAKYGKKIGPDPSSGNRAVIGGIVANNATGAHSLELRLHRRPRREDRGGTGRREYVLNLPTICLPTSPYGQTSAMSCFRQKPT